MLKKLTSVLLAVGMTACMAAANVSADAESTYDEMMDAALAEIISDEMTDYEKLEAITKYTATNFSYTSEHLANQLWEDLFEYGGGDCWANSDMISEMCTRVGIRNVRHDSAYIDAGSSGHINVVALIDGTYYFADAGFSGEKPRSYRISTIGEIPYKVKNTSDGTGAVIAHYYGFENHVVLPTEIGGKPVTSIGSLAFATRQLNKKGRLPYGYVSDWVFCTTNSVRIPDTVDTLEAQAFAYSLLYRVYVPSAVTSIPEKAFYACLNLSFAAIPAGVTEIGENAFANCSALTDVYFGGTEEEWNAIVIADGNEQLASANIHYEYMPAAGDADCDGAVSLVDIVAFQKWLTGAEDAELECWQNLDLNTDNKLSVHDLTELKRMLIGEAA